MAKASKNSVLRCFGYTLAAVTANDVIMRWLEVPRTYFSGGFDQFWAAFGLAVAVFIALVTWAHTRRP